MPHLKKFQGNATSRFPKPGTLCPAVEPEPFEAGVKAAFAAFCLAPVRTQTPPDALRPAPIPDGVSVRLRTEHPLVRCLLAFTDGFLESGGSNDLVPLGAAQERFYALIGFIREERQTGTLASSGLFTQDPASILGVADRLFLAAAIADLKWGRPFDRDSLLALAG